MTRAQRMLAAMRQQPVDRVPYCTYNCHPYSDNQHTADPTYAPILEKVRAQAGATAEFELLGLGPGLTRMRPGLMDTVTHQEEDGVVIRTIIHTPKGDIDSITKICHNQPERHIKPLFTSNEDMDKFMSIPYEPPQYDISQLTALLPKTEGRALAVWGYQEPMSVVAGNMGIEDFSIRCVTDLDPIKRVIDWAFERCAENLRLAVEACKGYECIFETAGPERCTPPMLSPRFYKELVLPYHKKLNRVIHDGGMVAGVHCHGHLREVFQYILDSDVDFLEPVEPPDQGNITLAELLPLAQGRVCLQGYIQDQEFYTAPAGHMTKKVEEVARLVRGRTGYIMCPTCTPFAHPCPEIYTRNYIEWLDAAERLLA